MDLHQFSLFLAAASIATLSTVLLVSLASVFSHAFREKLRQHVSYTRYMQSIGFLAIFSTISVLIYQLHYALPVCELCWWQRIFMFPIDIIVIVSLWTRMRYNHITILILSLFGVFFAGYHYYNHFKGWVLGQAVFMPCSVGGLLPSCVDNHNILAFGFLTIPGMALMIFVAIVILALMAHTLTPRDRG